MMMKTNMDESVYSYDIECMEPCAEDLPCDIELPDCVPDGCRSCVFLCKPRGVCRIDGEDLDEHTDVCGARTEEIEIRYWGRQLKAGAIRQVMQ
jgi:hypothetical protein